MLKIVTSGEMREMDRFAIKELGIPGMVLMENAGKGTFMVIENQFEPEGEETVYVFCGKGNNGGDGYVIGRYLWNAGMKVKFFVAAAEEDLKGDARANYDIIRKLEIPVEFISEKKQLNKIDRNGPDLVVDALLGTGIAGAVYGFMKDIIEFINKLNCPVISVDVPSGLNADSPVVKGEVVMADMTVTMALPKICHVFYPAKKYVGELYIVDIGIPQIRLNDPAVKIQIVESPDIELPDRAPDAHKYMCGKLSILAGSAGYTGAAALTSQAALYTGAGMVILGIPASLNPIMETKLTEVITRPYGREILDSAEDEDVQFLLDWCDVLAIGPGLGRADKTQKAIVDILRNLDKPVIIDADALYALAEYPSLLNTP
ncbi:MAG: NAD(P)H-hydrate epimerase, partial [Calditrichaeota bacterium]